MNYQIENCTAGDADYICDKLVEYNLSQVPARQNVLFETLDIKIKNDSDKIIAGCLAKMYCWNILYIDILWVDKDYRGLGLGTKLLKHIEETATAKGCTLIHLDTFDFQAKEFYEKLGYTVFGVLDNCPDNHCRYYLKKDIKSKRAEKL